MRCLIFRNEEVTEDECLCIRQEAYKDKCSKDLPKKVKRIIGWQGICKSCSNHKKPN